MVFAAEFGVGQVLWSFMWFTLFIVWISLVIAVFADVLFRSELSGPAKALWVAAVIFVPYLGVLAYVIVHGIQTGGRRPQRTFTRGADLDPVSRSRGFY